MPPERGRSQNNTSVGITGKWARLSLELSNPVSPTISHATAEYTLRRNIVNKKFEDLQGSLTPPNAALWACRREPGEGDEGANRAALRLPKIDGDWRAEAR